MSCYTYTITTHPMQEVTYNYFLEQLINEVVAMMGINRDELFSPKRTERVKFARWMVWEIMYCEKGLSMAETGAIFGKHDHSTVSSAFDKLQQDIEHKEYLGHVWSIILKKMQIDERKIKEVRKKRAAKKTFISVH